MAERKAEGEKFKGLMKEDIPNLKDEYASIQKKMNDGKAIRP